LYGKSQIYLVFFFLIKSSEEDLVKEEKEFQEKQLKEKQLKERELLKKRQALIDISSNKKN